MKKMQVAFVGNPNVGKSAWINALSDAHFKVGNWPGVTVEKKEATVEWNHTQIHLVDLPGTYALYDSENEEGITARYVKEAEVDLLINVVDATNLERNLFLTLQLRQLQIPMILIFNFMDEVKKYDIRIDIQALQNMLGISIYPYSAFDPEGAQKVKKAIISHRKKPVYYAPCICQGDAMLYESLYRHIQKSIPYGLSVSSQKMELLAYYLMFQKSFALAQASAWNMDLQEYTLYDETKENQRLYAYIAELMTHVKDNELRFSRMRKLDHFLLHPMFGMIFLFIILTLFMVLIFQGSAPWNDMIDFLINDMGMKYANAALFFLPSAAKALVLHGILAGVGGVLVFVPLMAFLHFALSILEECGYMARIAYLMDHAMQLFHLNGKSFVSLLLGFGCNVPAIYATRTLEQEKQKRLTALLVPFMSCGARLPVYMLFAAAFFKQKAAIMIWSIYGIGILLALLLALIFSHFQSFQDDRILIMELPPYRLPSLRSVVHKMRQEVKGYVQKATGVVLWAMIFLWGLTYFPAGHIQNSYLAQFAKAAAPIYEPLGFGTRWECIAALPGSIIAKETVVGFMDQVLLQQEEETIEAIHPIEDAKEIAYRFGFACREFALSLIPHQPADPPKDSLVLAIHQLWTDEKANVRAYSFMVYLLLSVPCIMTLQALRKEYGWRLMLSSLGLMLLIPYMMSWMIFHLFG